MTRKINKKTFLKELVYFSVIFVTAFFTGLVFMFIFHFEPSSINQILFHFRMPLTEDAFKASLKPLLMGVLMGSILIGLVYGILYFPHALIRRNRKLLKTAFPIAFFVIIFTICERDLQLSRSFAAAVRGPSDFYEKYYRFPVRQDFAFPAQKRNLIVIFLESVENTYADEKIFGENLMPHLSALSKENISFSGYLEIDGTQWTIASHVAMLCGVPLKTTLFEDEKKIEDPISHAKMEEARNDMSFRNLYCIPELLSDNGYLTSYLKGGDLSFSGTNVFLSRHGFQRAVGLHKYGSDFLSRNEIGEKFGFKDSLLYVRALDEIRFLHAQKQPFFFALLTLDTHFPDGYFDPLCGLPKNGDFTDVIRCSDSQLHGFLEKLREEGLLDNTTLILAGDHLTMRNNVFHKILKNKDRQIVNVFIDPLVRPAALSRPFTTVDMAPTILEAIGIHNPEHSFGLGRSLFSDKKTLVEDLSLSEVQSELLKRSRLYEAFLRD